MGGYQHELTTTRSDFGGRQLGQFRQYMITDSLDKRLGTHFSGVNSRVPVVCYEHVSVRSRARGDDKNSVPCCWKLTFLEDDDRVFAGRRRSFLLDQPPTVIYHFLPEFVCQWSLGHQYVTWATTSDWHVHCPGPAWPNHYRTFRAHWLVRAKHNNALWADRLI